jgi:hypothetical protein
MQYNRVKGIFTFLLDASYQSYQRQRSDVSISPKKISYFFLTTHMFHSNKITYQDICGLKIVSPIRSDCFLSYPSKKKLTHTDLQRSIESSIYQPPISQTFSLTPSFCTVLILNPCVGLISVISPSDNRFKIEVLPALSRPSRRIRTSLSDLRNLFSNESRPYYTIILIFAFLKNVVRA